MNRSEKQVLIDELHQEFISFPNAILVDFRGLSVPDVTVFRRKVRQAGSRYRVVKNSLALRAAKGTPLEKLAPQFQGATGIAFSDSDPAALAKVLADFAKQNPNLKVKAGLVSGSEVLDAAGCKTLSALPSLPELRAGLLRTLQAPATKLVRLLNTPAEQMVRLLGAYQEKQEGAAKDGASPEDFDVHSSGSLPRSEPGGLNG